MKYREKYSDERLDDTCVYCGKESFNRDHVPSKILLNKPYQDELPVVECCKKCNEGFSLDEEYFACLIECAKHGTTEPEQLEREIIRKILIRKPALRKRLDDSMKSIDGRIYFQGEENRIRNVLLKLAIGHTQFENSEHIQEKPVHFVYRAITTMTREEINRFTKINDLDLLPEVGSRAMQNVLFVGGLAKAQWTTVQEENYYYCVETRLGRISVKIIICDYLAVEIIWD